MRTVQEIEASIAEVEANADPDCCCCGDSMDHSPWAAGHMPVSARDYALHCLHEELAQAKKGEL